MTIDTADSTHPWMDFEDDELVTVRRDGQILHQGRVDGKTEDGRTVWILPSNDHRRLFHATDGVELARVEA